MNRASAYGVLLVAAMCWGFGNIFQKLVLDHVGPYTAVGLRCAIAVALLSPLLLLERGAAKAPGFVPSVLGVSLFFALGIGLQQVAYQWASVTNASFLVNACTVMTPLLAWVLLGRPPAPIVWIAAVVTFLGAFLMAGAHDLAAIGWGDLLCLQAAFAFAVWYVALERHARRFGRPVATTIAQFAVTGALYLPLGATMEGLPVAGLDGLGLFHVLGLGLISTAVPYGLTTWAQRHASAAVTAVILSSEGLFGAVGAVLVLGERLPLAASLGGALMCAAILMVAAEPSIGAWAKRSTRFVPAVPGSERTDAPKD